MKYKDQIKNTGLQIKKVAKLIGISNIMLSHYLSGRIDMPLHVEDKLKKIIKAYSNVIV